MLSLRSISKTYVTKAKAETQALKDVNLEIADSGMVFILGKSGSGKSTLLNLLGGLDSPTDGEIFVDGVSMQQFSQSDYAAYRNNYVGFIFQEFNLLSDFNVRDNVAIALRLTKSDDIDAKVSDALKRVELNDEYLTRRIDEMSGGEKQRIAIARALVKDSRLILADEPTGNLDSATGESIWNLLKSLSRERLVVVVSHDRESAEKYADRIIEIADGQIISDNGGQAEAKEVKQPKPVTKSRLSFIARLKMGYNNLKLRKAKTASVILVAIFSILSILITQMCLSYSPEVALADYIEKYNVEYFTVSQGSVNSKNQFSGYGSSSIFKYGTRKYVKDNCRYIYNGVLDGKQDILDFGLSFVGEALELDDNSFYTTTEEIESFYKSGTGLVEVDGKFVTIIKEFHPIEFLIGKTVRGRGFIKDSILAGVIDSGSLVSEHILPYYFYNKNFDGLGQAGFVQFNYSTETEVVLGMGNGQFDDKMRIYDCANSHLTPGYDAVLTADGVYEERTLNLEDNEIVLSYEIYAQLFDAKSKWYYIGTDFKTVLNIPDEIGQTFMLKLYQYETGDLYAEYEVKLAGVYFTNGFSVDIATGHDLVRQIERDFRSWNILVQASSVKNLKSFLTTLRRDYLGCISNVGTIESTGKTASGFDYIDVARLFYDLEGSIDYFSFIFMAMGAILLIILILLVINLISFSIASRKKEIGILSAIGTSNRDITGIFLMETGIIAAITFVIDLALSFTFGWLFNLFYSKAEVSPILFPFLRVDILTVVSLIALSFGLLVLAALIPIRKIIKLKPIDAIRNV